MYNIVYRIDWRCTLSGHVGQGEVLYPTRVEAQADAMIADRATPDHQHQVVATPQFDDEASNDREAQCAADDRKDRERDR